MLLTYYKNSKYGVKALNFGSLCLTVLTAAFITSSCAIAHKDLTGILPKPAEAKLTVTANVVDVDVDFKTRVKGQSGKSKTIMQAKDQAYFQALVTNNIDVLVDPVYEVVTHGKKSRATVTGFAG